MLLTSTLDDPEARGPVALAARWDPIIEVAVGVEDVLEELAVDVLERAAAGGGRLAVAIRSMSRSWWRLAS